MEHRWAPQRALVPVMMVLLAGVLLNMEEEEHVQLVEKKVRLSSRIIKSFNYLTKISNLKKWNMGLVDVIFLDNSPPSVGTTFKEVVYFPIYGNFEYECLIMSLDYPNSFGYSCNDWLKLRVEIKLEDSDKVPSHPTLVQYTLYSRRNSFFFKYLISPFLSFVHEASVRHSLLSLKYALED